MTVIIGQVVAAGEQVASGEIMVSRRSNIIQLPTAVAAAVGDIQQTVLGDTVGIALSRPIHHHRGGC